MAFEGDDEYFRVSLRKYDKSPLGSRLKVRCDIVCEDYEDFCKVVEAINKVIDNESL